MSPPIAILGSGPAGSAAALTLRRYLPDCPVVVISRPAAPEAGAPAVGETLSPGIVPLLEYLGLREEFSGLGHLPCGGTASAWGSPQVVERSYLFTGRGHGWHLDRAAFDAWLLLRVGAAGVRCLHARATSAVRSEGLWRLGLEGQGELEAAVVIDATGRSGWLARQQGGRARKDDDLVAHACWYEHDHAESSSSGSLVESIPEGWWYSATLPGKRGVAMLMTDRDLRASGSWEERLAAAPATSARLQSWRATGQSAIRAARSQRAETAAGEGWVAAGDAAAAFDPISALGIGFSLRSGIEAARVAVGFLEKDAGPAMAYEESVVRIYSDYRQRLQGIYRLEQRWPDHPFWARRQNGSLGG